MATGVVTLLQTQPLQTFYAALILAGAWFFFDKGQIESFNFAGRRIAIPGLLVIAAAINYKLAIQGVSGFTLQLSDAFIAFGIIAPITAFYVKKRM